MQICRPAEAQVIGFEQLRSGTSNVHAFIGAGPGKAQPNGPAHGPQAILTSFLPNAAGGSIPRTACPIPQFHVVMDGEATVGRHLVRPGSFHYSDAGSVSGPITPLDPEIGLSYFTLRPGTFEKTGGAPTPDANRGTPPRSIIGSRIRYGSPTQTIVSELLGPEDDGLGVYSVAVPSHATFEVPYGGTHGGKYVIVLEGTLTHGAKDLPAGTLAYLAVDETAEFTATSEGSELLVLQFPTLEGTP